LSLAILLAIVGRRGDEMAFADQSTVTVHSRRLRENGEPNPVRPRYIKTILGLRAQARSVKPTGWLEP
jgi:DNA-binding response OmpR family regulator